MKASHRIDRRPTSGLGGYDDGYVACPCFWGKQPSSLVSFYLSRHEVPEGCRVLDAGCGDGRNAQAFARRGADVLAIDISQLAIERATAAWPEISVNWCQTDIREAEFDACSFDVIVAYGILHCLRGPEELAETIEKFRAATNAGGYNIVCAFNERRQELDDAHPGFEPCLMPHSYYLRAYEDWLIEEASDRDLFESHPHNRIPHVHSMTRLLARKPD